MIEYSVSQTPDEQIVISLLEGVYKGLVVRVVDLKIDEDGQPSFELELPSTKTELFDDNNFIKEIQIIVGDILKKSIDFIWNTQEDLITIETKMQELLKEKRIPYNIGDTTIIEKSMINGYILMLKDKTIIANKMDGSKVLDLNNDEDFDIFRRDVLSLLIVN